MAVLYDNTIVINGVAITSLTTSAFTITSLPNRAGVLGLSVSNGNISGLNGNIGGVSPTPITNADSGGAGQRAIMQQVKNPPSGGQTASMSWTTSSDASLGVVTASGVDQTTPLINGNFANGTSATTSVTITSNNGDLTVDTVEVAQQATLTAPTQTQRWNVISGSTNQTGAGSTGPGTGTTTHQWTNLNATWASVGANFKAAAVPQSIPLIPLLVVIPAV